jgi:NitT/TauT family transport system permease protein
MSTKTTDPSRTRSVVLGGIGLAVAIGIWELLGQFEVLGRGWPPASAVLDTFFDDWDILGAALRITMWSAVRGFLLGLAAGFTLASIGLLITPLRRGIGRMATLLNSIPWIALGPLIVMVVSTTATPVIFAAMAVFFSSFVAISSGFGLVGGAHHDVFTVIGASKLRRFRRLEVPVVIPSIVYAAKLGAPAAMFGVVFGEWFGVPVTAPGLGVIIVSSLQQFITTRLWAAAGLTALMAVLMYGFFGLIERAVAARDFSVREGIRDELAARGLTSSDGAPLSVGRRIGEIMLTIWPFIAIIAFWQFAVSVWHVNSLVAPSPNSVISDIATNPGTYLEASLSTFQLAGLGLLIGTLIGTTAALLSWLYPVVRGLLTSPMIVMYSVPLVATVPILARVIGYTRTTVLAVAALVSMFPTFVLTNSGLHSTPPGSEDVFAVIGARRRSRLVHLALPSAAPNFLTAFRLNAALAFVAAILGEYMTGRPGLGFTFALSYAKFDMPRAWGAAVLIIIFSVLAYMGASWLEERGQRRML